MLLFCTRTPLEPVNDINGKTGAATTSEVITFAKKYCGISVPIPNSLIKTFDGGYALFGNSEDYYAYLMKMDGSGNFMWDKSLPSPGNVGHCVRETSDHGLIMASESPYGLHDFPIFTKVDSLGNVQWHAPMESLYTAYSIALSHDNGYVGTGSGDNRITVFKFSSGGFLLWTKTYGDSLYSAGQSIKRTTDNGFIVAGSRCTQLHDGNYDIFLMKIDAQGGLQWLRTFGGPYQDNGCSAIQTRDGGFVVAGFVTVDTAGKSEIYLVKTDANGNTKWKKGYFPCIRTRWCSNGICETSDGGFAICGSAYSKACIIKVSSNGTYKWSKSFNDDVLETADDIVTTTDGELVVAGTAYGDDESCFALIKTDSRGNFHQ
jgi:hypothetical protein